MNYTRPTHYFNPFLYYLPHYKGWSLQYLDLRPGLRFHCKFHSRHLGNTTLGTDILIEQLVGTRAGHGFLAMEMTSHTFPSTSIHMPWSCHCKCSIWSYYCSFVSAHEHYYGFTKMFLVNLLYSLIHV